MFTCTNPNLISLCYDSNEKFVSRQFVNLKKNHYNNFYASKSKFRFSEAFTIDSTTFVPNDSVKYSLDDNFISSTYSKYNSDSSLKYSFTKTLPSKSHFLKIIAHNTSDKRSLSSKLIRVSCGGCLSCRLKKATEWSVRCVHQYSTSNQVGCFLTLTYSPENLPKGGVLVRRHIQLFIKRLRKHLYGNAGGPLKYFCCGEYGDKNLRPHYHLVIFGYDFPEGRDRLDSYMRSSSSNCRVRVRNNSLLSRIWPHGHYVIGDLTYESAKYVASYSLKKSVGRLTQVNGVKEFIGCSIGLGKDWLLKNLYDVYKNDYVVVKTKNSSFKMKPPRYYDRLLKKHCKEFFDDVIKKRLLRFEDEPDVVEFSTEDYLKLESLDINLKSSQKKRL